MDRADRPLVRPKATGQSWGWKSMEVVHVTECLGFKTYTLNYPIPLQALFMRCRTYNWAPTAQIIFYNLYLLNHWSYFLLIKSSNALLNHRTRTWTMCHGSYVLTWHKSRFPYTTKATSPWRLWGHISWFHILSGLTYSVTYLITSFIHQMYMLEHR